MLKYFKLPFTESYYTTENLIRKQMLTLTAWVVHVKLRIISAINFETCVGTKLKFKITYKEKLLN